MLLCEIISMFGCWSHCNLKLCVLRSVPFTSSQPGCVHPLFVLCSWLPPESGWSWRRRPTWTLLETPGTVLSSSTDLDFTHKFARTQPDSLFSSTRTWETAKRTTRRANTEADGERLFFLFPINPAVLRCTDYNTALLQVSGSSPCSNGRSTKTAWWWLSSFVLLWRVTLWSSLQVENIWHLLFFLLHNGGGLDFYEPSVPSV